MKTLGPCVLLGVIGSIVACGQTVAPEGPTGAGSSAASSGTHGGSAGNAGSSTGSSSGASSGGGGAGGSSTVACPTTEPVAGAACEGSSASPCTYGDSVRPDCRDRWLCEAGAWTMASTPCTQPTPGVCPAAKPPSSTVCDAMAPDMGITCTYGNDICFCGCGGGPACTQPILWDCAKPPTGVGCPAVVPNGGTACPNEGVECDYGDTCANGAIVECTHGLWTWQDGACI